MKVKTIFLSLLTAFVIFSSGCMTPVAIDPTTADQQTALYQGGYFYAIVPGDADTVFRTAIRAIDNMGILRTGEIHKKDYTSIYARKVGDQKVVVRIRQIDDGRSEIRIRVGTIGDLPQSQKIYAKIRGALGT